MPCPKSGGANRFSGRFEIIIYGQTPCGMMRIKRRKPIYVSCEAINARLAPHELRGAALISRTLKHINLIFKKASKELKKCEKRH